MITDIRFRKLLSILGLIGVLGLSYSVNDTNLKIGILIAGLIIFPVLIWRQT